MCEALEHALNYDAARLNFDVLSTPSGAFHAGKVEFEIAKQRTRSESFGARRGWQDLLMSFRRRSLNTVLKLSWNGNLKPLNGHSC